MGGNEWEKVIHPDMSRGFSRSLFTSGGEGENAGKNGKNYLGVTLDAFEFVQLGCLKTGTALTKEGGKRK